MIQRRPAVLHAGEAAEPEHDAALVLREDADAEQEQRQQRCRSAIDGAETHAPLPSDRAPRSALRRRAPHAQAQALDRGHLDARSGAAIALVGLRASSTRRARRPCPRAPSARRATARPGRAARRRPRSARAAACARPRTPPAPRRPRSPPRAGTSTDQNETVEVARAPAGRRASSRRAGSRRCPAAKSSAEGRRRTTSADQQRRARAAAAAARATRTAGSGSAIAASTRQTHADARPGRISPGWLNSM